MNKKTRQIIQSLSKTVEEFGFDVGMHNNCYIEAINKRLQKYDEGSDSFYESMLILINKRLEYLKNRSKYWHKNNPNYTNESDNLINSLQNNSNKNGTIIAFKEIDIFTQPFVYLLKYPNQWAVIDNLKTINDVIVANITTKIFDIQTILSKNIKTYLVYGGIDNNELKHLTDLEVLKFDRYVKTPNNIYRKKSSNVWLSNDGKIEKTDFFIEFLKFKNVKVIN